MKRLACTVVAGLAVLALSGCQSKNGDTAYNEIGEMRVFEEPFRRADWEPKRAELPAGDVAAPSPLAIAPGSGGGLAQVAVSRRDGVRRHVIVGELDISE